MSQAATRTGVPGLGLLPSTQPGSPRWAKLILLPKEAGSSQPGGARRAGLPAVGTKQPTLALQMAAGLGGSQVLCWGPLASVPLSPVPWSPQIVAETVKPQPPPLPGN